MDLALACDFMGDFTHGQDMAANALRIKRDCQGEDSPDYEKYKGTLKRIHGKFKAAQKAEKEKARLELMKNLAPEPDNEMATLMGFGGFGSTKK